MKFTVDQYEFSRGLSAVARLVPLKTTLPVLSNILLETDNNKIKLSATNFETSMCCWIASYIEEEGATALPAKTLVDMVNVFSPGEVTITSSKKQYSALIKNYSSLHEVKGLDPDLFPPFPKPDLRDGIEINLDNFKELIRQVSFSASTDENNHTLNSIKVDVSGRNLTLTSTDGYRLSVRKEMLFDPVNKDLSFLVPARAMSELARINPNGKILTIVVMPTGQVAFHVEEIMLVTKLITSNYPNVKEIIPSSFKTRSYVNTKGLLEACKQAQVIARNGSNVARINLMTGKGDVGAITVSADTDSIGNSDIKTCARVDGEEIQISFDVRFLREVLEVIKTETVLLDTNASNSAAVFRPLDDDGYIHVLMPRMQ